MWSPVLMFWSHRILGQQPLEWGGKTIGMTPQLGINIQFKLLVGIFLSGLNGRVKSLIQVCSHEE